jgi:hypothetical protein
MCICDAPAFDKFINLIWGDCMKIVRWLGYFDLAVIVLAAILPTWFVLSGFDLLGATGWRLFSIANSYAIVVVAACAIASLGRRSAISAPADAAIQPKGRMAMSFLIVCVAAYLIWDARTVSDVPVHEISSPYISYLISVLFCAGAGYALAYLVFSLYQLLVGKR